MDQAVQSQHKNELIPRSTNNVLTTTNARAVKKSVALGLFLGLFTALYLCLIASTFREMIFAVRAKIFNPPHMQDVDLKTKQNELATLNREILQLKRKNDRFVARSPYLIISSSDNTFTLMEGKRVIRQGACSTGSHVLLKTSDNRQWLFRTPTGVLRVQDKIVSPVWKKPDWAFIEEGKPVPSPNARERFDLGVLGDYGLALGNGYLIHGTLYQRMLGMPVTHGCIRMGDEDLELVFQKLAVGSKVYIY